MYIPYRMSFKITRDELKALIDEYSIKEIKTGNQTATLLYKYWLQALIPGFIELPLSTLLKEAAWAKKNRATHWYKLMCKAYLKCQPSME